MTRARSEGEYRAGVIGHTGRGNYGHGLDRAFVGIPGVRVVALADADPTGRATAAERIGVATTYADYHEMLARERLDFVAVGPRHLDQHEAMIVAAAEAGARGIYSEKPLAPSLDVVDRILAVCARNGTKLAVAHQNRASPAVALVRRLIAEGRIGRPRVMRAFGKQDPRGGGQDLLVLGTHMLDLMRLFAGDARWCNARVCVDGRDATAADAVPGAEEGGLIAGDDIVAEYAFDRGITGTYESARADDGGGTPNFHFEFAGTGGVLAFWSSSTSPVYVYPGPIPLPDRGDQWTVLQAEPLAGADPRNGQHAPNQVIVRDLIEAVETGREPMSSGSDARAALEMILAVYESHRRGQRVALPLADREHPLERWRRESVQAGAAGR